MFGVCCRLTIAKCASGLLALSLPETCRADDDCPIASRCEYSRCCPLDNAEVTRNDEPPPIFVQKSTSDASLAKKVRDSLLPPLIVLFQPRCLQSPKCSSISLCPPRFTCSLDGKCCRLDVFCPNGTVPEDSCDENHLCPSSAHSCMKIGQQKVCCVSRKSFCPLPSIPLVSAEEETKVKREDGTCPTGTEEVSPRFGNSCRYSLQCPRPYFCNSRGKCCKPSE